MSSSSPIERRLRWRLVPQHTPIVKRRCPRCDQRTSFVSSDKFRVNGSGRKLDVWLIYKCEHCNQTWNSTIVTRVSPESLDKELYQNFLDNDRDTAWRYAFDLELLKRNQAEVDPALEVVVEGDVFEEKTAENAAELVIDVEPLYGVSYRADTLLAQRLGWPRKKVHALAESNAIKIEPKTEIDRRMRKPLQIRIDLRAARGPASSESSDSSQREGH